MTEDTLRKIYEELHPVPEGAVWFGDTKRYGVRADSLTLDLYHTVSTYNKAYQLIAECFKAFVSNAECKIVEEQWQATHNRVLREHEAEVKAFKEILCKKDIKIFELERELDYMRNVVLNQYKIHLKDWQDMYIKLEKKDRGEINGV